MAWLNFAQSEELISAAYKLAEEIRAGEWSHVFDPNKPVAAEYYPELIDELGHRCPGYTADAYKRALADGIFGSMW